MNPINPVCSHDSSSNFDFGCGGGVSCIALLLQALYIQTCTRLGLLLFGKSYISKVNHNIFLSLHEFMSIYILYWHKHRHFLAIFGYFWVILFFKYRYTVLQKYRHTRNLLETRVIIKISAHPCYPTNVDWFSWEWSKKKNFKMSDSKKLRFSKLPILKKISWKFHALVLGLVGLIDAKGIGAA